MAWARAAFKGQKVWARVGPGGELLAESGRVAIRYTTSAGAKVYQAGVSNVSLLGEAPVDLPDGAPAAPSPQGASGRPSRGSPGFGSAGSRTAGQAALAEAAARELLGSLGPDAVVAFTDGACRGNPGPAGSGALVVLPGGRRGAASLSLGTATNNVGELAAVGLALDLFAEAGVPRGARGVVLTDSTYAHGVLVRGWKAKANRERIEDLRKRLAEWPNLALHWVAGHVGIEGNERADALANLGADGVTRVTWTGGS